MVDLLAIRHLVQGVSQVTAPRRLEKVWVAVDVLHALSMVPVVIKDQRHRRAALVTGSVATLGAVGSSVLIGRAEQRSW